MKNTYKFVNTPKSMEQRIRFIKALEKVMITALERQIHNSSTTNKVPTKV